MFEKLKQAKNSPWVRDLRDVRAIGFIVFGIIVLLVSWSTVGIIQTNYELQRKISRLEQQNRVYELEKNNLRLRNEYYGTDQYLELTARKAFGRAAPGERVYIVPEKVALAHTVPMPETKPDAVEQTSPKPTYQRNFEAWMNFLFHRAD